MIVAEDAAGKTQSQVITRAELAVPGPSGGGVRTPGARVVLFEAGVRGDADAVKTKRVRKELIRSEIAVGDTRRKQALQADIADFSTRVVPVARPENAGLKVAWIEPERMRRFDLPNTPRPE